MFHRLSKRLVKLPWPLFSTCSDNVINPVVSWPWLASCSSLRIQCKTHETDFSAVNITGRVRNLKNQLLQIDPPTIVECSLWYPIARSTMKPEAWLLSLKKQKTKHKFSNSNCPTSQDKKSQLFLIVM